MATTLGRMLADSPAYSAMASSTVATADDLALMEVNAGMLLNALEEVKTPMQIPDTLVPVYRDANGGMDAVRTTSLEWYQS